MQSAWQEARPPVFCVQRDATMSNVHQYGKRHSDFGRQLTADTKRAKYSLLDNGPALGLAFVVGLYGGQSGLVQLASDRGRASRKNCRRAYRRLIRRRANRAWRRVGPVPTEGPEQRPFQGRKNLRCEKKCMRIRQRSHHRRRLCGVYPVHRVGGQGLSRRDQPG